MYRAIDLSSRSPQARAGHYRRQLDESIKNLSVDIVGYLLSICLGSGIVSVSLYDAKCEFLYRYFGLLVKILKVIFELSIKKNVATIDNGDSSL
jgi:hypothetical protein